MKKGKWRPVLAFGLGLASVPAILTAGPPAHTATNLLDGITERKLPASAVPGMAYGVVVDGRIVESGQRGVKHVERPEAVSAETTFLIGSISKSFTALAVMQLVEGGTVQLDAPIARYLDVFAAKPAGAATVRQLLSHTSGYSTIQGNRSQTDVSTDKDALRRRVAQLADVRPQSAPGTQRAYSNANYQILGRLIEVASGLDYATYVETNVLAPAGLEDTYVHGTRDRESMATGHRPWFGTKAPLRVNKTGRGSEGGIASSARDMARYLGIMMNGKDDILSAAGKELMMTPASEDSPEYGLGWALNTKQGTVFHGGSNPGFQGLATMIPDDKKGVVILVNAGSGFGFGEAAPLLDGLTASALGLPYAGETGAGWRKATFAGLAALPILFAAGMVRSWRRRDELKARMGFAAELSDWGWPILALGLAWGLLVAIPRMHDVPFAALYVFRPDIALLLALAAASAVLWAFFRFALVKIGRGRSSAPRPRSNP